MASLTQRVADLAARISTDVKSVFTAMSVMSGDIDSLFTDKADVVHGHALTDANITGVLPIAKGGTGASSAAAALTALGVTATAAELNFVDGVTSAVQTQINGKAATVHGHVLTDANITGVLPLAQLPTVPVTQGGTGATTAAAALVNLGVTATAAELNKLDGALPTVTEINFLDGVTSPIQTQINGKAATVHGHALTDANITGILPIAQVPVATSGTSSATQVVRADDSRLSDSRRNTTVRALGTGNEALSGLRTIWGVALVAGDRILLTGQTSAAQNGIYTVASGAWARAADANTIDEFLGMSVIVEEGIWATVHLRNKVKGTDVLGTTAQTWVWSLDNGLDNIAGGIPRLDGSAKILDSQIPYDRGAVATGSLNGMVAQGTYRIAPGVTELPAGAYNYGVLIVSKGSTGVVQQYVSDSVGADAAKSVWIRSDWGSDGWGAWVDLLNVPAVATTSAPGINNTNVTATNTVCLKNGNVVTVHMDCTYTGAGVAAGASSGQAAVGYRPSKNMYTILYDFASGGSLMGLLRPDGHMICVTTARTAGQTTVGYWTFVIP